MSFTSSARFQYGNAGSGMGYPRASRKPLGFSRAISFSACDMVFLPSSTSLAFFADRANRRLAFLAVDLLTPAAFATSDTETELLPPDGRPGGFQPIMSEVNFATTMALCDCVRCLRLTFMLTTNKSGF